MSGIFRWYKTSMRVEEYKKRLRIRFSYQGQRKCLSLELAATATNRIQAEKVLLKMQSDIEQGYFDPTLSKYKPKKEQPKTITTFQTVAYKWLKVCRNDVDNRTLEWYKGAIKRAKNLEIVNMNYETILEALNGLSHKTAKRYLKIYKDAWEWGVKHHLIERLDNPLESISLGKKRKTERPQPFTVNEIRLILDGFHTMYPIFKPIIIFMFETGCRTSEALGLKWADFNQDFTVVTISRQLSRGEVKPPKNGKVRRYKLSLSTTALLTTLPKDKNFVFHNGNWDDLTIHGRWEKVLKAQAVKYRKPYNTRHTFISHCLANGANLYELAQVTGHDPTVLLNNYAGMLNEPTAPGLNY